MRFYVLALAACAMVGVALASWIYHVEHLVSWTLWGLLTIVWLFPFVEDLSLRRFDLFELKNVFLVYYGLQFVVWTGIVLATGQTRWNIPVDVYFDEGILMSLVGLVAFIIGYRSIFAQTVSRMLPAPPRQWDPLRCRVAIIVCSILGIIAFYQLMNVVGGMSAYLLDRETFRSGGLVGKSYLVKTATFVLSIPAVLMYSRSRTRRDLGWAAVVFVLGLIPAVIIGFRTAILFPIFQVLVYYHYVRRPFTIRVATLVFVPVFTFMAVFGLWRNVGDLDALGEDLSFDTQSKVGDALFRLLSRSHGGEILAIINEKVDTEGVPFAWGLDSAIEMATVVIPRDWYPDKIEDVSFRFGRTFFSDLIPRGSGGVSPTVIGELYWNFSWPGIFGGMWLIGVFCHAVYLWMKAHRNLSAIMVYGVLASYVFFLVEAPTVATDSYLPNIVILVVVLRLISPIKVALHSSPALVQQRSHV